MPSTYSSLKIQLMATGENTTTWGGVTNTNLGTAIEEAIVGSADVTFASNNVTLTLSDTNTTQTARNMRLRCTGTTGGATRNLVVPSIEKPYIVQNDCADSIVVKTSAGTGITVPAGKTSWVYSNGTNVVDVVTHLTSLTLGSPLTVAQGGTGAGTLTGVVIGNGTSAFTVKANPTGDFVGTTDTQTLTGKTIAAPANTLNVTLSGTGMVSRNLLTKLAATVTPEDFGAVGAALGSAPPNDTSALTAFFNYLNANPGVIGLMGHKVYGINAELPKINKSGVKVRGTGQSFLNNVGAYVFSCTTIQWIGGTTTGVMQRIEPDAGASNQILSNVEYFGVAFNCAGTISQGVIIRSVRSSLLGIGCSNATATGVTLGVLASGTLGENESLQTNDIYLALRQVDGSGASGVPLRLQGSATANVSLNRFRMVEIVHANTSAVIEENADNNVWEEFRSFATGTATYSVEWLGSSAADSACRAELFDKFSANKPAVGRGTGTYAYAAYDNIIMSLDADNATPFPVYETGASGYARDTRGMFVGSISGLTSRRVAAGDDITNTLAANARMGLSTMHLVNGSTDHMQLSDASNTNRWSVSLDGSGNFRIVRLAGSGNFNLPTTLTIPAGGTVTDTGDIAATSPGFRGLPQLTKTAAYTLALTDAGKHISITTGGITIPPGSGGSAVLFPLGTTIVVYNDSSSTQTIAFPTGTLRWAGTTSTGTRTLATYGVATLIKVSANEWVASGNLS